MLLFTNVNILPFSDGIPSEVISYLDPTIEKLYFEEKNEKPVIHLKFKGKEQRYFLSNILEHLVFLQPMIFSQKMRGISETHLFVPIIPICKKVFTKPRSILKCS